MRNACFVLVVVLFGLSGAACGGGAVAKAPPPLRPTPAEVEVAPPAPTGPTDCGEPQRLPALTYGERSIPEAERLANQGFNDLRAAETPTIEPAERERLITAAVDTFIQALLADPYNVHATYNLAAAYARIERPQCSIRLLQRLVYMRDHASKKAKVEEKLDRLLGRNKQALDPDFNEMRSNPEFRALIRDLCKDSQDPGCVHGR